MNEHEAREWVADRFGAPKVDMLERFGAMLRRENERQNLVAASTISQLWSRHLMDSAQLVPFAPAHAKAWCDVGSGAGLPGIIVAILRDEQTWLIEPRGKRVGFLAEAADALGIASRTSVISAKAERFFAPTQIDIISARAVASLPSLFSMCEHLTSADTRYILPKGQRGRDELASVRLDWHGTFHVEQSLTAPDSTIILADGVKRRCSASR